MNNRIRNYVNSTKSKYQPNNQSNTLIPERTTGEGVDNAKAECQKKIDNRLKELSKDYDNQKNRIEEIPLTNKYLITVEPTITTIKINESPYTINKNIGSISKNDLINSIKNIKGGNGGTTSGETAFELEKKECDKKLPEQFKIIENNHNDKVTQLKKEQELEDNNRSDVTIPGGRMSFKATDTNTIISKKNVDQGQKDLCAEFGINIGLIKNEDLVEKSWNYCDNNLATSMGQSVNDVTKKGEISTNAEDTDLHLDDLHHGNFGGKYKKNSKLEKKKTFRYRIKRNKLGRFVKGKTRKSHL